MYDHDDPPVFIDPAAPSSTWLPTWETARQLGTAARGVEAGWRLNPYAEHSREWYEFEESRREG